MMAACTSSGQGEPIPEPPKERATVAQEDRLPCGNIGDQLQRMRRGWVPVRSQDISLLPREPNYIGSAGKPVHTGPWDYLAEVPLVVYGPGQVPPKGPVDDSATMADVAPTIASLIGFDDFDAPDGRPLLEPSSEDPPRLVVTVVWDGGGFNALYEHEGKWPFLARIMQRGVSFTEMEIGSTPSNTPPIHTTLGTGAFPRDHGIPAVKMEIASGEYIDPYEGNNADRVTVPTLADVYDAALNNEPKIGVVATVNWHLGMIGHGAHFEGGDRDVAMLMNDQGEAYGDATAYEVLSPQASLTAPTDYIDAVDGARDFRWMGRDLTDPAVRYASPAYVRFQADALGSLIASEGFGADGVADLLFTNFKSVDDSGHRFGMTSGETGEVIGAADDALRSLVEGLNEEVGRGRWVVIVTADHGQTPYPKESGGWPIGGGELRRDANAALDGDGGGDLVTRITSAGAFVNDDERRDLGLSLQRIARWIAGYTVGENVKEGSLPKAWRDRADEPLFDAALIEDGRAIVTCARR